MVLKEPDYLNQFDVFVVSSDLEAYLSWSDYPSLASKILELVEAGKSILGIVWNNDHPLSSFAYCFEFQYSGSDMNVDLKVQPSPITNDVKVIKFLLKYRSYYKGLSGRYAAILYPEGVPGLPNPPPALVVYGYYGSGKYVVISNSLFSLFSSVGGDTGILLSNIMYWLTNREIPPPPSFIDLDEKINELNKTINSLSFRIQQLSRLADQLSAQLSSSNLESRVDQISQALSNLESDVNQISSELSRVKKTITELQAQTPAKELETGQEINLAVPISIAVLSLLMSIIALAISTIRRR